MTRLAHGRRANFLRIPIRPLPFLLFLRNSNKDPACTAGQEGARGRERDNGRRVANSKGKVEKIKRGRQDQEKKKKKEEDKKKLQTCSFYDLVLLYDPGTYY